MNNFKLINSIFTQFKRIIVYLLTNGWLRSHMLEMMQFDINIQL